MDESIADGNSLITQFTLHMRLEDQGHAYVNVLCKRVVKGVDCIGYNILENDFAKEPQNNNRRLALNQMVNPDVMHNTLLFQWALRHFAA